MIMVCHGIIDQYWIDTINNEMFEAEKAQALNYEGSDSRYLGNSYGLGDMPGANCLMHQLTPLIKAAYGDVRPANSYSRIYYNGSILNPHIDRPGLDVTMTICTYSDIDIDWPLYVDFNGTTHAIITPVGSAAIIKGTLHNHYRERLICADDAKVVQIFLHWTRNV